MVPARWLERALLQLKLPEVEYRPYQLKAPANEPSGSHLSGPDGGPKSPRDMVKRHLGFKTHSSAAGPGYCDIVEALGDYQNRLTRVSK